MIRRVPCYCPRCRKWWTQDWEDPDECPRCGSEDPEETDEKDESNGNPI